MIGQYLLNNNEKRYSTILLKILHLNRPQMKVTLSNELTTPVGLLQLLLLVVGNMALYSNENADKTSLH
jgi:hypothetical protein